MKNRGALVARSIRGEGEASTCDSSCLLLPPQSSYMLVHHGVVLRRWRPLMSSWHTAADGYSSRLNHDLHPSHSHDFAKQLDVLP